MSAKCIIYEYFSKVYFGLFFAGECVQKHDSYMVTSSLRMIIPKKKRIWPICRLGSGYQFDHCDCHAHWSYDTTDATEQTKINKKNVSSVGKISNNTYGMISPKIDFQLLLFYRKQDDMNVFCR